MKSGSAISVLITAAAGFAPPRGYPKYIATQAKCKAARIWGLFEFDTAFEWSLSVPTCIQSCSKRCPTVSAAYVILGLLMNPQSTQRVIGYGETFGEDRVKSAFQTYLDVLDINPPHLKATNEVVGRFLDFLANERQPTDDENSGECLLKTRSSM